MIIQNNIPKAVEILTQGNLVAFPTETVYGLGADARNPDALRKIFLVKERPMDHPLIVHIGDLTQLSKWAVEISDAAWLLAKTFWPGPLTLILKKAPHVSDWVTGNQQTIGLRIPNHPVALALLHAFGSGLAAPSANKFGRISPTTAQAVREELGEAVTYILEGGACEVGVESTIVDVTGDTPIILRPGMISAKQIVGILKKPTQPAKKNAPRVSGSLESHYAPHTPTRLMTTEKIITVKDLPVAILIHSQIMLENKKAHIVDMSNDPKQYAHDLYKTLRDLDKQHFEEIIIETVPEDPEWDAIRDRLIRASS